MNEPTTEQLNAARGCACLTTLSERLNRQVGREVDLQLAACFINDPQAENFEMFTDLPPLVYKFKEKGRTRTGHIRFSFCPFCGKKR